MLKLVQIICVTLLCHNHIGYSQDTIVLSELSIREGARKAKVKKIDFGYKKDKYTDQAFILFNSNDRQIFYLIDNLPHGILQELTLNFSFSRKILEEDDRKLGVDIMETEYAVTLYEESEQNVLRKLNDVPINIVLEGGSKWHIKKSIDVSGYNLKTNRFYVYLHRLTPIPCDRCDFYLPTYFKTDEQLLYTTDDKEDVMAPITPKLSPIGYKKGLYLQLKTLTKDY